MGQERGRQTVNVEFSVDVDTPAERLWDILANVKAWPEWEAASFVRSPTGAVETGTTFQAGLGGLVWAVSVTEADRPRKLAWVGRRTGLWGVHEWEFVEEAGRTRATTRETMHGWLLPLLYPMVKRTLAHTDEKWLADLKARAESSAVPD